MKPFAATDERLFHLVGRGNYASTKHLKSNFLIVNLYDLLVELVSKGVHAVKSVALSMAYDPRNSGPTRQPGKCTQNSAFEAICVAREREYRHEILI